MSTTYNTSLVTSGLVICNDPANNRSYTGTTTTTNNLISSVNTGTLSSGVGYSNGNNGFFVFNGSSGYINYGNDSSVQLTNGTICVWARTSGPGTTYRAIVNKQLAYGLFYNASILIAYDYTANADRSTGINLANGLWTHITYTFQSGVANGSTIYINGSSVNTAQMTVSSNTSSLLNGGQAGSQWMNGNIGHFTLYNRVLTYDEILQNYNATKKRYL